MRGFKNVYLENWEDFVDKFIQFENEQKKFIFRGQSNSINDKKVFQKWNLTSSFNRIHRKHKSYSFSTYLFQHFDSELFDIYYSKYPYVESQSLSSISLLQKCYFFQHYGIPTCFIDFTFDPLIALYFSISTLEGTSGGLYDDKGNPLFYSNDSDRDYVSIYQINVELLQKLLGSKEITESSFNIDNLESFNVCPNIFSGPNISLGLDLNPISSNSDFNNYNLKMQKGCFLYYDNEDFKGCLEEFIELYCMINGVNNYDSIITIYNINYNSLFKKNQNPSAKPLFRFLKERKLTGEYLFNDIQGLKYDFNFFHNQ